MRTFSPMTDSTETSISSPIMMLWLDLRVKTSILGAPSSLPMATRRDPKPPEGASINPGPGESYAKLPNSIHPMLQRRPSPQPRGATSRAARALALVSRTVHAPEISAPAPQPDTRLGAPGADGCVGRTPARGHRPRHRAVQAP